MVQIPHADNYTLWNGPVCWDCGKPYVAYHSCDPADLEKKAALLQEKADVLRRQRDTMISWSYSSNSRDNSECPCRRENGGSGVCGCALGGTQITC